MKKQKKADNPEVIEIRRTGTYLSIAEAARRLSLTRQAVLAAVNRDDIPKTTTPWGFIVHEDDVKKYTPRAKRVSEPVATAPRARKTAQ